MMNIVKLARIFVKLSALTPDEKAKYNRVESFLSKFPKEDHKQILEYGIRGEVRVSGEDAGKVKRKVVGFKYPEILFKDREGVISSNLLDEYRSYLNEKKGIPDVSVAKSAPRLTSYNFEDLVSKSPEIAKDKLKEVTAKHSAIISKIDQEIAALLNNKKSELNPKGLTANEIRPKLRELQAAKREVEVQIKAELDVFANEFLKGERQTRIENKPLTPSSTALHFNVPTDLDSQEEKPEVKRPPAFQIGNLPLTDKIRYNKFKVEDFNTVMDFANMIIANESVPKYRQNLNDFYKTLQDTNTFTPEELSALKSYVNDYLRDALNEKLSEKELGNLIGVVSGEAVDDKSDSALHEYYAVIDGILENVQNLQDKLMYFSKSAALGATEVDISAPTERDFYKFYKNPKDEISKSRKVKFYYVQKGAKKINAGKERVFDTREVTIDPSIEQSIRSLASAASKVYQLENALSNVERELPDKTIVENVKRVSTKSGPVAHLLAPSGKSPSAVRSGIIQNNVTVEEIKELLSKAQQNGLSVNSNAEYGEAIVEAVIKAVNVEKTSSKERKINLGEESEVFVKGREIFVTDNDATKLIRRFFDYSKEDIDKIKAAIGSWRIVDVTKSIVYVSAYENPTGKNIASYLKAPFVESALVSKSDFVLDGNLLRIKDLK